MPDWLRIADSIVANLGTLAVNPDRCGSVRSVKNNCRACEDVCPKRAITVEQGNINIEGCIECGLCTAVCPTEALKLKEPTLTQISAKVEEAFAAYGEALIYCSQQKEEGEKKAQGVGVLCLGSFPPEFWLACGFRENKLFIFRDETFCHQCTLKKGEELFEANIAKAKEMASFLSLKENTVVASSWPKTIKKKKKNKLDYDPARRELFTSLFDNAKKIPALVLAEALSEKEEKEPKLRKQKLLVTEKKKLLKKVQNLTQQQKEKESSYFLLSQPVSSCYFCKVCVLLCPAGALEITEGEEMKLLFSPLSCTACGLCTRVCLYSALALKSSSLAQSIEEDEKIFFKGEKKNCRECGKEFLSDEKSELCPMCITKKMRESTV